MSSKVTNEPLLHKMMIKARLTSYRVWAINAPFDKKDLLKGRGYRWSSGEEDKMKSWYFDALGKDALNEEQEFLSKEIYFGNSQAVIDEITAFKRYSERY